ncbi:hypothetical protein DNTS_004421 [Danionella cerebrum]|uniref:DUF3668 domain-containing protein n=1 Tax=Danionella cerebrum TaxID=2873325 RepID=A0A553NHA9_9TELE|nr:hypothetical protein DNTS_004421 [Danionella translucida]
MLLFPCFQLIPSSALQSSDFFFFYSLLGNDVTSEPFQNLLAPNFEPERASVRIRSSERVLRAFFSQQSALQIHMCCGNQSLGSTEVSLAGLLKSASDPNTRCYTIEGAFTLRPPNRAGSGMKMQPAELQPTLGVSVSLRAEDVHNQLETPEENGLKTPVKKGRVPSEKPIDLRSPSAVRRATAEPARPRSTPAEPRNSESEAESLSGDPQNVTPKEHSAQAPPIIHHEQAPPTEHEQKPTDAVKDRQGPAQQASPTVIDRLAPPTAHDQSTPTSVDRVAPPMSRVAASEIVPADADAADSSVTVSAPKIHIPASAHHYCFSLELRSIRDLRSSQLVNCFLRYAYQFFGSAAPIMTSPAVELKKNMEVFLPQSFCAFDFAALPSQLQDTFLRSEGWLKSAGI